MRKNSPSHREPSSRVSEADTFSAEQREAFFGMCSPIRAARKEAREGTSPIHWPKPAVPPLSAGPLGAFFSNRVLSEHASCDRSKPVRKRYTAALVNIIHNATARTKEEESNIPSAPALHNAQNMWNCLVSARAAFGPNPIHKTIDVPKAITSPRLTLARSAFPGRRSPLPPSGQKKRTVEGIPLAIVRSFPRQYHQPGPAPLSILTMKPPPSLPPQSKQETFLQTTLSHVFGEAPSPGVRLNHVPRTRVTSRLAVRSPERNISLSPEGERLRWYDMRPRLMISKYYRKNYLLSSAKRKKNGIRLTVTDLAVSDPHLTMAKTQREPQQAKTAREPVAAENVTAAAAAMFFRTHTEREDLFPLDSGRNPEYATKPFNAVLDSEDEDAKFQSLLRTEVSGEEELNEEHDARQMKILDRINEEITGLICTGTETNAAASKLAMSKREKRPFLLRQPVKRGAVYGKRIVIRKAIQ